MRNLEIRRLEGKSVRRGAAFNKCLEVESKSEQLKYMPSVWLVCKEYEVEKWKIRSGVASWLPQKPGWWGPPEDFEEHGISRVMPWKD